MNWWGIIQSIACGICQKAGEKAKEPKPEIEVLSVSRNEARAIIQARGVTILYGLLDSQYYYTTFEGWGQVFRYVYMVEQPPVYLTNRFDCEDWAIWLKAMVSYHFGLSFFAVDIGDVPQGKHGYNWFYSEIGEFLLEPQLLETAEPFKPGEKGYNTTHTLL